MSEDTESLATAEQLENLKAIFDKNKRIETDDDLLELAKLVEEEGDEKAIDGGHGAGSSTGD